MAPSFENFSYVVLFCALEVIEAVADISNRGRTLIETAASEVVSNDHISDSVKNELDVLGVGSTRHVAIDFFCSRFVFGLKLSLDVSGGLAIFLGAWKM